MATSVLKTAASQREVLSVLEEKRGQHCPLHTLAKALGHDVHPRDELDSLKTPLLRVLERLIEKGKVVAFHRSRRRTGERVWSVLVGATFETRRPNYRLNEVEVGIANSRWANKLAGEARTPRRKGVRKKTTGRKPERARESGRPAGHRGPGGGRGQGRPVGVRSPHEDTQRELWDLAGDLRRQVDSAVKRLQVDREEAVLFLLEALERQLYGDREFQAEQPRRSRLSKKKKSSSRPTKGKRSKSMTKRRSKSMTKRR